MSDHTRHDRVSRQDSPSLVHSAAKVSAVLTLHRHVLIASELAGEGVRAADEDEGHGGSLALSFSGYDTKPGQ